jgi:hypothetical protein
LILEILTDATKIKICQCVVVFISVLASIEFIRRAGENTTIIQLLNTDTTTKHKESENTTIIQLLRKEVCKSGTVIPSVATTGIFSRMSMTPGIRRLMPGVNETVRPIATQPPPSNVAGALHCP